jgi:hypothetical protein
MSRTRSNYPFEIAEAVCQRWAAAYPHHTNVLPAKEDIAHLIDAMYQASLLREETEPVLCRIIIGEPSDFECELQNGASPLHVLQFEEPCELSPHQIRKLAAAAGYYRSLLSVRVDSQGNFVIWGIVATGTDWVNRVDSSSEQARELPPNLVLHCLGPGHLIASSGFSRILESSGGRILTEGFDPFRAKWLPQRFGHMRTEMMEIIDREVAELDHASTKMCDDFVRDLAQSVVRRTLRLVRNRQHGGMLVYLSDGALCKPDISRWLRFRVRFTEDDSTQRFRRLMLQVIRRARQIGHEQALPKVTYRDYRTMRDSELAELEESLIDFGHFLADLMSVDGALVLDRNFRLIGFGAEILGDIPVHTIHRAKDLEAAETIHERADASGTRHRSAYRLVTGLPDTIAIVVSQDGDVRFVAHHQDRLTYWPYLP